MIRTRDAHGIHQRASNTLARLSEHERDQLALCALVFAEVRVQTLDAAYYHQALELLRSLAPSMADEVNHLLQHVEELHRRINT